VFTLAETLMLGSVSALVESDVLATAIGTTMGVVAVLVLFASQTKYDFTSAGPYLMCALWSMIFYSICGAMFGFVTGWFYGLLGTILFSFFIVYDMQLIIGGKGRHQLSVDDYVFAALNLYLDIINLFLHILQMLSKDN
jgi:FtsH-binding integral membrane protein